MSGGNGLVPPPPPAPPSNMTARPVLCRQASWIRTSPPADANVPSSRPRPPPPSPEDVSDEEDASSHSIGSSFTLGNESFGPQSRMAEPRSGMGPLTPKLREELRKLMEAGGVDGLTRRIVEQVEEQLKSGSDSEKTPTPPHSPRFSRPRRLSASIPPPPPNTHCPPSPPIDSPGYRTDRFPRVQPPFAAPHLPTGPTPPQTPPASPKQGPQGDRFDTRAPLATARRGRSPPPPQPPVAHPVKTRSPNCERPELSPVDKCWGELFDANGRATARLGQVLRGVANYLIAQPHSETVVIAPSKLAAFYAKFTVENDPHPFADIFRCREGDRADYKAIRYLFKDLECEHHLIQHASSPRSSDPEVPALTPAGFVKWLVMAMYAYPDEEARRLNLVMSRLPIEADGPLIDGRPERLPKQLSRHLLPARPDRSARRDLDRAVDEVLRSRSSRRREVTVGTGAPVSGSGGGRLKSNMKRSDSEPLSQGRMDTERDARHTSSDTDSRSPIKKRHVSFSDRIPSRAGSRDGRPYNFADLARQPARNPTPSDRRAHEGPRSPRHAPPATGPSDDGMDAGPSPTAPHFELSSGRGRRDRERDEVYKYPPRAGGDAITATTTAPQRRPRSSSTSGNAQAEDGPRRRRRRSVVVSQERGSATLGQFLRDSAVEFASLYNAK